MKCGSLVSIRLPVISIGRSITSMESGTRAKTLSPKPLLRRHILIASVIDLVVFLCLHQQERISIEGMNGFTSDLGGNQLQRDFVK
jgi:hypothetical protein